jgi:autotransporter-associated beta strand protein
MINRQQLRHEPSWNLSSRPARRRLLQAMAAAILALSLPALAQTAGDYRSAASGNWNNLATWETYDGANWWPAGASPTAATAGVITIQSPHFVTNSAAVSADEIVVAAGGTLAASSTLTVANGNGVDLDVSGTLLALGGSSVITLQAGTELTVRPGGLFVHSGTSSACVNNGGATLTVQSGGKFQLRRSGATVPVATWEAGSTCEVNYSTASTSRPASPGLFQAFSNFHWNNTNQTAGNDLANSLTNVGGNFTIDAGLVGSLLEFKMFNSSGSGGALYGGNLTINAGRLNWASAGGPYTWTVRGNILINAGTAMDVSGSAGGSYTLLLDSGGVQNYTCPGNNLAVKLNWNVASGTTLNLNDDLSLTAAGRTLTADGTVNLNGKTVSADLVAGTGTIRNQGGGTGWLALGAANGANTLDGTLALQDGASGSLGLIKRGSGALSIWAAQGYSGGMIISNGTVLVENLSGSGTGTGTVTVFGGTLGGSGRIAGAVSTESGATLSPGSPVGALTINSPLTLAGNTLIEVDKLSTNDLVIASAVNYGGTLTITDVSGGLSAGDSFTIFSAGSHTGDFASIVGSPGVNLEWRFNPASGVLSVVDAAVTPPTLLYAIAGNTLVLSWTEPGFKLQSQTNSLTVGVASNWSDYPEVSNPVVVTLDPASPAVFFRLAQ